MAEKEIDIETRCNRHAEAFGWQHGKLEKARKDWPDRIYFGPNCAMLIVEFKRPGEKPRKRQKHEADKLRVLGHPVEVIDNLEDFKRILQGAQLAADLMAALMPQALPAQARSRPASDELH